MLDMNILLTSDVLSNQLFYTPTRTKIETAYKINHANDGLRRQYCHTTQLTTMASFQLLI